MNTKSHTIELFVDAGAWQAKDSDPQVRELFGTDTIPTAFLAAMPANEVLARIQRLNPRKVVTLRS